MPARAVAHHETSQPTYLRLLTLYPGLLYSFPRVYLRSTLPPSYLIFLPLILLSLSPVTSFTVL